MFHEKDKVPDSQLPSTTHDDPSTKMWSPYISRAEKHSRNLAQRWKGDMDSILIFAGLFSASLTAFIIESYKTLLPDNNERTIVLLERITVQLAAMANTSTSAPIVPAFVAPGPFVPPASALICNVLWFLSLGFSLACALSATLVEQWARNYLLATESRPTPHERARVYEYLYKGLKRFHMASVVEAIPLLLHISLFLFFVGLVEFLRPLNVAISILVSVMLLSCIVVYALATIIPVFQRNCPYSTPLSGWSWTLMQTFHLLYRRDEDSGHTMEIVGSMTLARELEAIEISSQRDQRDLDAMSWTLKALRDDTELEPFIEVIPPVVAGFDYNAKLLLRKLLDYNDISVRLDHRISRLLLTCSSGLLDPSVGQKRATTCLAAIWSLTMMSIISGPSSSPSSFSRELCFDDHTLRDMAVVKVAVPGAGDYAVSAMAVVARTVLDMYLNRVAENEQRLAPLNAMNDGIWSLEKVPQYHRIRPECLPIFEAILRRSRVWERYLRPGQGPVSMPFFVVLSAIDHDLTNLVSIAVAHTEDLILTTETLKLLRDFRATVNQCGFFLTVEYAASLFNSGSLPFEAFGTIRRLFLSIDFAGDLSVGSQRHLVAVLDDALEPDSQGGMRIPQSIVNIMLGLTAALKDQTSVIKAMSIILRNIKFFPSEDEAHKALSVLHNALPCSTPTLDLFTSHMYANTRLDQSS